MFCPKCGQQNPETGKFCRSCGTDLGNVSQALSGEPHVGSGRRRRERTSAEAAYTQLAMGMAFVVIAIILGVTGKGGGWWFWMFIPGFMFIANGIAKVAQGKNNRSRTEFPEASVSIETTRPVARLTPAQTDFVPAAESRYTTGELVPPSVTEGTTRHLEIDSEGKTMTLPKN